jgi:hypothetical protein
MERPCHQRKNKGKKADAEEAARIPAPGEGKRGESGYLAYLLRQASAANRLNMERRWPILA